jgi:L-lactate dehydrogenase complex protein LldF
MEIVTHRFKKLSKNALSNPGMMESLRRAGRRFAQGRTFGFSQLANAEALRNRGREIREFTIDRMDEFISLLESKVKGVGGVVHRAKDAEEARNIITQIASKNKVRSIVKGKSMMTEEIGLNEALIKKGFEVLETDLGEFIIQLAGETPFHIVGPAIHKTKEEVADLFQRKLGCERVTDPEDLTMIARRVLRRKFIEAEMGITGANFAVSETGTVVLFENEGNIRLTTTLPRIHVAIMGIEKVVPRLDDLIVMMMLLARSATGQKLSSYVSMITGPKRSGEWDGPDEFHLVIIDNGRSRIIADSELKEILYCIRCGACLNFCPVYQKIGGHAYGWVYSGPMGQILAPQITDPEMARDLPFACTLCGACSKVCPVKIEIPKLILALRARIAEDPGWRRKSHIFERAIAGLVQFFLENPSLYRKGSRIGRLLQLPFRKGEMLRWLPPPFMEWSKILGPRALAKRRFFDIINDLKGKAIFENGHGKD